MLPGQNGQPFSGVIGSAQSGFGQVNSMQYHFWSENPVPFGR